MDRGGRATFLEVVLARFAGRSATGHTREGDRADSGCGPRRRLSFTAGEKLSGAGAHTGSLGPVKGAVGVLPQGEGTASLTWFSNAATIMNKNQDVEREILEGGMSQKSDSGGSGRKRERNGGV